MGTNSLILLIGFILYAVIATRYDIRQKTASTWDSVSVLLDSINSELTPDTTNIYNLGEPYRLEIDTTKFDYEYYPIVIVIKDSLEYKITTEDINRMTDEEFEKIIHLCYLILNYSDSEEFNGSLESDCKLFLPEWILNRREK